MSVLDIFLALLTGAGYIAWHCLKVIAYAWACALCVGGCFFAIRLYLIQPAGNPYVAESPS